MRNNPLTRVECVWSGSWEIPQNKGHSTPLVPPRYKLSSTHCCQLGPTSVYAQTAEQRLSRSQAFSTVRLVLQRRPSKIQLISVENKWQGKVFFWTTLIEWGRNWSTMSECIYSLFLLLVLVPLWCLLDHSNFGCRHIMHAAKHWMDRVFF